MTQSAAADKRIFLRVVETFAVVCLCVLIFAQVAIGQDQQQPASQRIITRIYFDGNRRIGRDTLLARMTTREGDVYDPAALDRDFHALYNTHFFTDIRLEAENDPNNPNGVIITFYLTERPVIRRIEYVGEKSISESDILDAYKDKKLSLSVDSQYDPTVVMRARVIILALLAEHGRQFATVKPTIESIPAANAIKLVFNINEGPKVKVGLIKIEGNHAFSTRKIIRSMHDDRPYGIPLGFTFIPVFSKTFDADKLNEDLEAGIRNLYTSNGYLRADPEVKSTQTVSTKPTIPFPWDKNGKATNITISIQEGAQYRLGTLRFVSADPDVGLIFRSQDLARIFPMKKGDVFSTEKLRKSFDTYRDLYGSRGYIDFTPNPVFDFDDKNKVVNLTLEFDQQKQYYVRRIEFSGNTTTRDKVIRREIVLDEGQVYNKRLWDLSILRLNQLGYFDTIKDANTDLQKDVKNGTVDILLKVKEKAKQSISLTGGVSGLTGSFIGFSYQTNNFLGLGETLTLAANIGSIERELTFGFTEPYMFDRPLSVGFTVFDSKFDYNTARQYGLLYGQSVAINPALQENYNTDSKGFTLSGTYPIRKLPFFKTQLPARFGLTYGWSTTNITTFSQSASLLFELTKFTSLAGPNALKGIESSKITPSLTYNSVNSAMNPTAGKEFSYSLSLEGGPMGGNVNSLGNAFDAEYFHPSYHHRNVIAMHFLAADITGYGGKDAPPYNKFYLGGENDIRGYYLYTISPFVVLPYLTSTPVTYLDPTRLNSAGQPIPVSLSVPTLEFIPTRPGGDFKAISNIEYRIPIAGPVEFDLFHDMGLTGIFRTSELALDPSAVALLHEQFPNASTRPTIMPGTNFTPHTSVGLQVVVQLPIIGAPVRIYYAWNYLRVRDAILPPLGEYPCQDATEACTYPGFSNLPGGVLDSQIRPELNLIMQSNQASQRIPPALLEPDHTLNFTVSRTF
ncbi:MAG TPA: outer membrane protein assembly factor BamA [Candidatus Aquilonibacter sp.]|nr:outer membrane protein assembly factor BamA [Candidatus Aquilonibacter sp.]